MIVRTYWHCEVCDTLGYTNHDAHEGVMDVVYLIGDDHHRRSPDCQNATRDIRIVVVKEQEEVKA